MRKKIVIFGAGGTLGLYLVDHLSRLLSADEWEVIASGRSDIAFFDRYAPLVRYVQADITDEKSFAALPQQDVYAVVHFAGALPAYMEGYDPRRYVDANVMGTLNAVSYTHLIEKQSKPAKKRLVTLRTRNDKAPRSRFFMLVHPPTQNH